MTIAELKFGDNQLTGITRGVFKWSLLAYLAILPMAETIALRNVLLFVLLVILLVWGVRGRGNSLLQQLPVALLVWCFFLLLFPLWAAQPDVALVNLKGQWGLSIAAWAIGFFAVLLLGRNGLGLWDLVHASAFLVGLHLVLTLVAWAGFFGTLTTSDLPWSSMAKALAATFHAETQGGWHWQSFPWGFRGFDPMHGNLGYTASQTVALLVSCFLIAQKEHGVGGTWKAAGGIVLCFFSIVVANSRGAVLYSLLLLLLAAAVYVLHIRRIPMFVANAESGKRSVHFMFSVLLLVFALFLVLAQSLYKDGRWNSMLDKARAGFLLDDPVVFLCQGLSPQAKAGLQARLGIDDSAYLEEVIRGLNGDGGRVILMRAGLQLMMEQPLGLDGSRHSYKTLMEERCGHRPTFEFAHSHQAWIDTSLALGWGGALLFASLLSYFAMVGWQGLRQDSVRPWAFALFLLSTFWILRGFTDSVYREHYLQMQALLLGYLYARVKQEWVMAA